MPLFVRPFVGRTLHKFGGVLGAQVTANTDEVKELRREAKDLKEVVAEQTLELRLLKNSMFDGRATTNEVSRIREVRDHPAG